jgi:hypothetical protein
MPKLKVEPKQQNVTNLSFSQKFINRGNFLINRGDFVSLDNNLLAFGGIKSLTCQNKLCEQNQQ